MGIFRGSGPKHGGAEQAKEDVKQGKIAKGKSSQVIQRKAGSGGNRAAREEKRQ